MQRIKIYGDNGSPCLIPLKGRIGSKVPLVHQNRGGNCRDTTHNQFYKTLREVNFVQHKSDETLLELIVSLLHINFNCHETNLTLLPTNSMNELLGNNSIIRAPSPWKKCSLEWRDEIAKQWSQSSHRNF